MKCDYPGESSRKKRKTKRNVSILTKSKGRKKLKFGSKRGNNPGEPEDLMGVFVEGG